MIDHGSFIDTLYIVAVPTKNLKKRENCLIDLIWLIMSILLDGSGPFLIIDVMGMSESKIDPDMEHGRRTRALNESGLVLGRGFQTWTFLGLTSGPSPSQRRPI